MLILILVIRFIVNLLQKLKRKKEKKAILRKLGGGFLASKMIQKPSQSGGGSSNGRNIRSTKKGTLMNMKKSQISNSKPFNRDKEAEKKRNKPKKKLTGYEKVDHFLVSAYQMSIEMSLVDLCFSTTFNLQGDWSTGKVSFYAGKISSAITLTMIFVHYGGLIFTAQKNHLKLSNFERDLMEEGIDKKAFDRFKSVRSLSTVFKLKTVLLMIIIVVN